MNSAAKKRFEILEELPGLQYNQSYFPRAAGIGGGNGLIVRFYPETGESWIGIFKYGYPNPKAITGVYSWPDPKKICVISRGQAYIVQIDNPSEYYEIKEIVPVMHAFPILDKKLFIFGDFIKIAAFSGEKIQWISGRLSFDGLKISEITTKEIRGEGWDAITGQWILFTLDVATGEHKGGAFINN